MRLHIVFPLAWIGVIMKIPQRFFRKCGLVAEQRRFSILHNGSMDGCTLDTPLHFFAISYILHMKMDTNRLAIGELSPQASLTFFGHEFA